MSIYEKIKKQMIDEGLDFVYPNSQAILSCNYIGYKNGENLGKFDSESAAKKAGAVVVEKIIVKNENIAYEELYAAVRNNYLLLNELWNKEIKEKYNDLNEKTFDLIMSKVLYEEGGSHSEIETYFCDYYHFAKDIIKSNKE